ncbi:MAG: hypothetical protein KDA77_14940, partial [Planctomycetaceae bacterium]|nr:hypothetical protein [Planctomycetaceae bacterium]
MLNPLQAEQDQSQPENTGRGWQRLVSLVVAGLLTCVAGWWVQRVRTAGGLSLPYIRPDIIVVSFLCVLPFAMRIAEWMFAVLKQRNRILFLTLQLVFFIGTAGIFSLAFTSDQASVTLSQEDAWESYVLRPVIAFWIMMTSLFIAGTLFRFQEPMSTQRQGILVWLLLVITALAVPAFYIQSRVDEMVTRIDEYLGSGRLGDARQLTREVCLLSPWGKISGTPVGDLARDLDRDCYEIERNLAFMKRRPVPSEEFTYQQARLLTILGQPAAAARLLEAWTGKSGTSPLTYQLLGTIYQQQENWERSEQCCRQALTAWEKL